MSFRKIDIDALEENRWVDTSIPVADIQTVQEEINQRSSEVRQLLSKSNYQTALKKALENPPYGCDDESLKNKNLTIVMEVLGSFKSQEVADAISQLDPDEADIVMKYVYRAMAYPSQFNCSVALVWHEKLVESTGLGSIVRVQNDRRTV